MCWNTRGYDTLTVSQYCENEDCIHFLMAEPPGKWPVKRKWNDYILENYVED
jgi:hypothetical protein